MAAEFCKSCRARTGQLRAGVHQLNGEPACEDCFLRHLMRGLPPRTQAALIAKLNEVK